MQKIKHKSKTRDSRTDGKVIVLLRTPAEKRSSVIVISPLNALIRDQIVKMRECGLSVCVLRGDRVDTEDGSDDGMSLDVPVEMLSSSHFDLIFTHPEVLVDNKKVSKLLKTPSFKVYMTRNFFLRFSRV